MNYRNVNALFPFTFTQVVINEHQFRYLGLSEIASGLNSEFFFSKTGCHTKTKDRVCPTIYLQLGREEMD